MLLEKQKSNFGHNLDSKLTKRRHKSSTGASKNLTFSEV
jgi:hypothetical protein